MDKTYIIIIMLFTLFISILFIYKKPVSPYRKYINEQIKYEKKILDIQNKHLNKGLIPIPSDISRGQNWTEDQQNEYCERANRAMRSKDPRIKMCVDGLTKLTDGRGYGSLPNGPALGEYSSYEYCQWMIDKETRSMD